MKIMVPGTMNISALVPYWANGQLLDHPRNYAFENGPGKQYSYPTSSCGCWTQNETNWVGLAGAYAAPNIENVLR